jgi:hypothetical protein
MRITSASVTPVAFLIRSRLLSMIWAAARLAETKPLLPLRNAASTVILAPYGPGPSPSPCRPP